MDGNWVLYKIINNNNTSTSLKGTKYVFQNNSVISGNLTIIETNDSTYNSTFSLEGNFMTVVTDQSTTYTNYSDINDSVGVLSMKKRTTSSSKFFFTKE